MRSIYLVILAFAFPVAAAGQNAPTQAFQQWARQHVHTITSVDKDVGGDADLRPLRGIIGGAHVLAFGEPFHGGHEPLAMRNRLIRYAVTQLGFTTVALETRLATSKRLYDYVLGKTTEEDAALKESFSNGFGDFPENLELIQWLRAHNATQPPARRVNLYGFDTGDFDPNAYRSIEAVLAFLDRADPNRGGDLRKQYSDVISVFRSDKYVKLTQAEKDAVTGKVQDMLAFIRRERIPLSAATSRDEYDWALREALNAAHDDAYLRSLPPEFDYDLLFASPEKFQPSERWEHNREMRELAMADNLEWVRQRESTRGKIIFFAHDVHVQTSVTVWGSPNRPIVWVDHSHRPAGMYLRSAVGGDLVVIGTYFGHGVGFPAESGSFMGVPLPPDTAGMDSLLRSLSIPLFMMDLRELPRSGILHEWFQTPHETRSLDSGDETAMVAPIEAYDAILFIDTITPTPAPHK